LEQDPHLLAGAAAKLYEAAMRTELRRDIGGKAVEDRDFGAGQVVLGEIADFLKQRRAARVIEEFARQRFRLAAETGDHRVAKALLRRREIVKRETNSAISHHRSSARRSPE